MPAVLNKSVRNFPSHVFALVLHTYGKCLGDARWAVLRAITIGARDVGIARKIKGADERTSADYTLSLLACTPSPVLPERFVDLQREASATVSGYPPHTHTHAHTRSLPCHHTARHEALRCWGVILSINCLKDEILHGQQSFLAKLELCGLFHTNVSVSLFTFVPLSEVWCGRGLTGRR